MGLLEKAQQRKKELEQTQEEKIQETTIATETKGLLEKAQQRKKELEKKEKIVTLEKTKWEGNKEIIEEKTGFGWKGLGTRRIVYDHSINEYVYELIEPELSEQEEDLLKKIKKSYLKRNKS